MVRKYQWYDPVRIKRIRIVLSILIWISWIMILFSPAGSNRTRIQFFIQIVNQQQL